ncbi:MAG: bifunctional precorrin-2 dehydrogenase/sirohydrochlorin ferrochelatase [Nitrospirae bacterium]|nr:bifunctional precorrin-2 dehydrogenase/sirohydrochlorin ferrochelatase [Nitrospirota bacterium]
MKYYPIFLNLHKKKALVVGGGRVAERKIRSLLKAGASVTVISPDITKPIEQLKSKGLITCIKRRYKKSDLKSTFIVIAATSSAQANAQIDRDAGSAGRLVNVVDTPSEGNFIVPSIVSRGHLTIAISTEGHSPAVSKAIRKELEKLYGAEFTIYLRFLGEIRRKAMEKIKDSKKRKKFFQAVASEKMFNILRNKGFKSASEKAGEVFNLF